MKRLIVVLGLLALSAIPALAAESSPPPTPLDLAITSPAPACPSVPVSTAPGAQDIDLPPWLASNPLLWSKAVAAGCGAYCRECGGCCAILGPGSCACC
jgi:hypothetical protein